LILHNDGLTYIYESSLCDGSDPAIIASRTCTIANEDFTQDPLSLPWGAQIYVKIVATNIEGDSLQSLTGTGVNILKVPDAPINLSNAPHITLAEQIGLTW
jgi:hypothetical protein